MSAHYGIALIPNAHKNALNVVIALLQSEDPSASENVSQPSNATGDENDPFTHWYGGRQYSDAELVVFQALGSNIPSASWPVTGVSGAVSLADAQAACAALVLTVTTQDSFTTGQAQATLAAALTAQGLQKIVFEA